MVGRRIGLIGLAAAALSCGAATCIVDSGGRAGDPSGWSFGGDAAGSAVAATAIECRSATRAESAFEVFDVRHYTVRSGTIGTFSSKAVGLFIVVR